MSERTLLLVSLAVALTIIGLAALPHSAESDDERLYTPINYSPRTNTCVEPPRDASKTVMRRYVECFAKQNARYPGTLVDIVDHESDFQATICNQGGGCGSGQGLTQIVPSTFNSCTAMDSSIRDPLDPSDNLRCALLLLGDDFSGLGNWDPYSGPYRKH